jgi:flagellar hook-associated protein 2
MASISSPGIGSGIDVQSIVSQLVALEKAPLTKLETQANSIKTKISTYGTISSQVSALGDAAFKLGNASGWNSVTATSSNASAISVKAAAGAPVTSLTMEVSQLAKAQSTASSALASGASVGAGTLTIELGRWNAGSFTAGSETPVNVTINAGEDSLSEIAAKINDADAGVSATVLKDASGERLLLRSKETGAENGFRITASDADGNNGDASGLSRLAYNGTAGTGTTLSQAGRNAMATINGVAIETASNTLSDTLPGLTIQLSQVTTAPVEIDVSTDQDAIRANVQAFVDAYNSLNNTLATTTKYDEATKTAGTLQGDATAVGLQNALRGMMRSTTASSPFSRLSDIGIEIKTGGAMSLDAEKFSAALGDLEGLKDLFTVKTGDAATEGFGRKIDAFADGLLATDGLVTNRKNALQKSMDRNSDEQDRVNDRAARAEVRYLAQYNAMDANVAKLNSLNSFVTQQIALWNS